MGLGRRKPWPFQDLDRLLLFTVLPAQSPQLFAFSAGQLARGALTEVDLIAPAQLRRLSRLTQSSRANSVTVLPEGRTSAIASRRYSAEHRLVYLLAP